MDAWSDQDHPAEEPDEGGGRVMWLFDADAEPPKEPLECSPVELFALLEVGATRMGLDDVVVTGVVGGLRRRRRWCSFELAEHTADADSPAALVRVVLFATVLAEVEHNLAALGRELGNGMSATVAGAVRFDPPWGGVRVIARSVELHHAPSGVAARREALLAELAASGLLTAQSTLVVPGRPLHIGVIAGEATAGSADLQALLDASGLEWQLSRRTAPMAGPHAPQAVATALRQLARMGPDVIVIARGGGGHGELAFFDSEVVAHAIAGCPVPVWTAIGHVTDSTVADRVANRCCATPSAAAAALVERVRDYERHRQERTVRSAHAARMAAVESQARRARHIAVLAVLALVLLLLAAALR